jgi:hypothetical protein
MTKTQIEERAGGYTRFKQTDHNTYFSQKWKETVLDVRRVNSDGRNETQIEVEIERCVEKKALRVYKELSSFTMKPKDALRMAFALYPELLDILKEAQQALEEGQEYQGNVLETIAGIRELIPEEEAVRGYGNNRGARI